MKKSLLISLILSSSLYAADDVMLEDIEVNNVRGNKDERTYLETPESISVLKPKSLNRGDLNNSVQMLDGLSNVQTSEAGQNFSIRGISDMGVTGYQKDNLASILVDDVFQTTLAVKAGSFENWDLESIEVLRGAQSTSQGVNSLAGNILLYHSKPTFENSGAAKLTLGNYGRKEAAVLQNINVVDNKFAVRLGYNKEITDGYIKNATTGNDKWGSKNKDHFSADFLYRFADDSELRLNLKLLRMNQGGIYVQGSDPWDYKVFEDQDYKSITNNEQIGLTHTKKLNENFSNKLILAYSQAQAYTTSDADGTPQPTAGERKENDKDKFMSFENQLMYKSEKVKNVLGIHLHRYSLNNFYDFNLLYLSNPYPVTQENNKERYTYAIFDSYNYRFDRHHSVNLGGRLEVVKNEFKTDIQSPLATGGLAGARDDSTTNTVALPKLGYTYENGHYALGALYTQGYRTGGVSINRQQAKAVNYDPEKTNNYELSYKYMQKRFLFTTNVFYTKWKDQQVEIRRSTFDTQVENVADSELYGAEVEASYEFENDDSVRVNLGHVKTRFLSFNNNGDSLTGNAFPDAAEYTGQVSYWKFFSESWKGILTGRYLSDSYSDPENLRKVPSQFYMDANIQYSIKEYMAEFYVRNIFDQKYRLYNGFPRNAGTDYQTTYYRMSPPREFGARLNYYW